MKNNIDKVEKTKLKFQGESQVLYVVDTDDVDTSKEDLELLEKITEHVKNKIGILYFLIEILKKY